VKPKFNLAFACAALLVAMPAIAQNAPKKAPAPAAGSGTPLLGFGSNSKEPIKVDANSLEVFDKESRAVYTGDVVVVQGQTTMRCTTMVVFYNQARGNNPGANPNPAAPAGQTSIRQIDCAGPVSLLSGTQSATSDKLVYEAEKDIVTLTGKVVIADCDNVQRGERAIYDVKTGRANVDAGPRGRVQGVFTPGGEDKPGQGARPQAGSAPAKPKECPAPAAAAAPAPAAPKADAPPRSAAPTPPAPARTGQASSAPMQLRP
jgi:lipopolysaccharide export system protein LptA